LKFALVANTGWYLYNFRRNLMLALRAAGHEIVVISPPDTYGERLAREGFVHVDWNVSNSGQNPWSELRAVFELRRVLEEHSIDAVLSYTPKGNIYSGLACLRSRRVTVPNISGLGRSLAEGSRLAALTKLLYRIALQRAPKVYFQNEDDREMFTRARILGPVPTERLMGSGVDLFRFQAAPLPCVTALDGEVVFLLVARLIWDKGIRQYVEAARIVRQRWPAARFRMLGALPAPGPASVSSADLQAWETEGLIEYLGTSDDVPAVLREVDCMVLPSYYREGVPRSLIEASAMGRPCITTDMPGCRDVVEHGATGWLCTPRDVGSLVERLEAFLELPSEQRQLMGARARQRAEQVFDERVILRSYLATAAAIAADRRQ
jgi:glycosyltransferase involved in cell wall biosynthesis